jgi:metal-responsive CopG/Arc/MetJ family transcriptional regulator
MNAMKMFLLRMPESMSNEIDQIAEELYCTKSQFVRQAIMRNLDIIRQVEQPAIREFYRKRLPNLH